MNANLSSQVVLHLAAISAGIGALAPGGFLNSFLFGS